MNYQSSTVDPFIKDSNLYDWVQAIMENTTKADHVIALTDMEWSRQVNALANYYDKDTIVLLRRKNPSYSAENSKTIIGFHKKEVGALIQFSPESYNDKEAFILTDYLLQLPKIMKLNDAQILEAEFLLNKVGMTLGIELPPAPVATSKDQEHVLKVVALEALKAKPKASYHRYLEVAKANGTPIDLTQEEFIEIAEYTLKL